MQLVVSVTTSTRFSDDLANRKYYLKVTTVSEYGVGSNLILNRNQIVMFVDGT
jgi:membrane protease subunit (stomatin/prohibitin family)